ncbi:MAG TPA: CoA ester lyase [Hyphomicrobiaceae bacterium]|nr:CoA ester lyase [Hyphomicrobiaceae bacterium]
MRSLLFVPGDSERKLARALSTEADALILDLEDSVASDRKALARQMTREFIASAKAQIAQGRPRLYVRINNLATRDWQEDIAAVMQAAPDGILLPKSRSGEDVHQLSVALGHAEERVGLAAGSVRIIALATEVPASLLLLHTYVGASSRLEGLTWGAEDLSVALGAVDTREASGERTSPYRLARDLTLFTAAAAGAAAIDTVYVEFRNSEGLRREAEFAARDGFTAKLAVHPDQVPVINAAFTPTAEAIAYAEEIVRLFRDNPEAGVVALDGRMIDRPHLIRAERMLARAKR